MKGAVAVGLVILLAAVGAGWYVMSLVEDAPTPNPGVSDPASTASGTASPSPSPTPDAWEEALELAASLSVEQAAGSVIMPDISSDGPQAAAKLVKSRHLAGVLIMGGAVNSEADVKALTAALAQADPDRGWPIMIATDQEGGIVQRLQPVLGYTSAFMAAGANGDEQEIRDYYAGLGAEMAELGFTMDMAPVADVTLGTKDPTIRTRAASSRPDAVAKVVGAAWQGLAAGGVTPVIKHFPGHGSVTQDSHRVLPVQKKSIGKLEQSDLLPFAMAVSEGAPAVMMGHIQVSKWGKAPASVNPKAYKYLREELGFEGLAVTDAMNMKAITDRYGPGKAAATAVKAGADLVVMPANLDKAIDGIVNAVEKGTLKRERLNEAAARVIITARAQAQTAPSGTSRTAQFVEGSIVVAAKNCEALIGKQVTIKGGTSGQRETLEKALADRGVEVGSGGTTILLVEGDRGHGTADVVVATGGPWGLPNSKAQTYVATWGAGGAQLRALAAVLSGDVAPRGTWPVSVKLPYGTCN